MKYTKIDRLLVVYKNDVEIDEVLRRKIWQFQQKMEGRFLVAFSNSVKIMRNEFGVECEKDDATIRYISYKPEMIDSRYMVIQPEKNSKKLHKYILVATIE